MQFSDLALEYFDPLALAGRFFCLLPIRFWRQLTQCWMWELFVVDCDPVVGNLVNLIKIFKQISIQDFVPVGSVEPFNKSVLDRFYRLDVSQFNAFCFALLNQCLRP